MHRAVGSAVVALALVLLTGCASDVAVSPPAATAPASSSAASSVRATDHAGAAFATPTSRTSTAPRPTASPTPRPSSSRPSSTPSLPAPAAGTALAQLGTLPVKGRSPKTGYRRDQFGSAWTDVDRNGCDTRNDILATQLTGIAWTNSGHCRVASGTLVDPYTGTAVAFVRGQGTSELVQIDHVVALSDAWQKGAQQLTAEQRIAFANDPLNLQATTRAANSQKSDGDAATWLPAVRAYRCTYVARQIAVKSTYRLWVTAAERDAMARVLGACSDQPVADRTTASAPAAAVPAPAPAPAAPAPAAPAPAVPAPAPAAPVQPAIPAPAAPGSSVYYPNCRAARAAGVAPLHRGDPGYRSGMDGDGDGIACE
ncbi:DUF1524 domain-containing protein [Tersicoccus sp. Bi-70]|uniref:GmrSD restriction endonuclease domain-containing protein n=1 Tax=Tersicoccus sp. Bi-70 TaxID=1897634 RepID=UPI0009765BFB|nr:DUF1524 domain-containing protein [Tersicoccus sp. Bi-70]OMH34106.1 hypothetical protein BGP79_02770 [Tersicoccus sp. Bi-70]